MVSPMSLVRNSATVVKSNILAYYQYVEQLCVSHYLGWHLGGAACKSNARSILVSWTKRPPRWRPAGQRICKAMSLTLPRQPVSGMPRRVAAARRAVASPKREGANGRR